MNVEALSEFGDGLIALDGRDRHLRLERRCVVTTRTTQDDLLLPRGSFAPQPRKSSHSGLFGYPRPPLISEDNLAGLTQCSCRFYCSAIC